jgi:hypothetical protein
MYTQYVVHEVCAWHGWQQLGDLFIQRNINVEKICMVGGDY